MKKLISLLLIWILLSGCASTTTNVNINTNVGGARVTIDGKEIGQTPINSVKLKNTSGKDYQITIEKEGYKTYEGVLRKEENESALTAVIIGFIFIWLLFPALLLINAKYLEKPLKYQYFILEKE